MSHRNVPMPRFNASESRPSRRRASGRNIKLQIAYDGTNYQGWQVQNTTQKTLPGLPKKTIQQTLEKVLSGIVQEKVKIIGSGRTDAGVHAQAQIANFITKSKIPLANLQMAMNSILPNDIAINKIAEACLDFHSRFDAKSKLYRYTILNQKHHNPFLTKTAYFFKYPLDIKLMQQEALVLLGRHNFQSFQTGQDSKRNPQKVIKKIRISKKRNLVFIDMEANGFLRNMARNIVGTLIEVGRGKLKKGSLRKVLLGRDRRLAGPTAPANGLCLMRVNYE